MHVVDLGVAGVGPCARTRASGSVQCASTRFGLGAALSTSGVETNGVAQAAAEPEVAQAEVPHQPHQVAGRAPRVAGGLRATACRRRVGAACRLGGS